MRILLLLLFVFAAPLIADTLVTTDGDTFIGKFDKLENGEVHFTSLSAGALKVPAAKVASLTLDAARDARIRTTGDIKDQKNVKLATRDGKLLITDELGEREADFAGLVGVDETLPDERALWELSGLGSFSWTDGNTKTYTLGYRFDIKRTTKHNYQTLFARGTYFQDRLLLEDQVRVRQHHVGYLYRYIFDFNLTIDLTQDFYFNEFAGYHYRSITGIGPGYYIIREPKMSWHVAAHATYTYEDQMFGAENRGYFGARLRTEFDWVTLSDALHVNFKSELLFDFDETKNLTSNSSLLVEYKFMEYFTAGVLVEHAWDNLPPPGFKHHDFRFTLTLGFSWSGRWV